MTVIVNLLVVHSLLSPGKHLQFYRRVPVQQLAQPSVQPWLTGAGIHTVCCLLLRYTVWYELDKRQLFCCC